MSDERKDDGGPAFPVADVHQESYGGGVYGPVTTDYTAGMSLRDYFAAQAAQRAADATCDYLESDPAEAVAHAIRHAKAAYMVADAMLAARKAGER